MCVYMYMYMYMYMYLYMYIYIYMSYHLAAAVVKLRGLCGWFRDRIRTCVGGLGSGSGPMWEVLGAAQGLSGRPWGRTRASVGDLGRGSGRVVVQTGAEGGLGIGSGPNPSGRAIQNGRACSSSPAPKRHFTLDISPSKRLSKAI